MRNIAIVNELNLTQEFIVHELQNEFRNYHISAYCCASQYKQFHEEHQKYDLIIIDIGEKIFDLISTISFKNIKIAAITSDVENYVTDLFKLGLNGYLSTEAGIKELAYAIKNMMKGKRYISPNLSAILYEDYINSLKKPTPVRPKGLLTRREWEVLECISNGYNSDQIADHLYISPRTVNNHTISIFKKLNVKDRTKAAVMAIKEGWVILDEEKS